MILSECTYLVSIFSWIVTIGENMYLHLINGIIDESFLG
jgi:hypothetical protein